MTRPITDSPWFWCYLFATAGLILLIAIGPKWIQKQTRLENRAAGIHHQQQSAGATISAEEGVPQGGRTLSGHDARLRAVQRYRMVIGILAVAVACGWIALWWTRRNVATDLQVESQSAGG